MFDFPSSPSVGQKYPVAPAAGQPQWNWDGEKWAISLLSGSGLQAKKRVFFTTQTYVPTPGMQFAAVICQGPGGGGGGVAGVASNNSNGGGGGSAGTTSGAWVTAAQVGAGVAMTIPAGATGGAAGANAGNSGSTCSFGSLCTAPGGIGGAGPNGVGSIGAGGTPGAAGTGDWTIQGQAGGAGLYVSGVASGSIISNQNVGGSSPYGGGGRTASPGSTSGTAGQNAFGYGAGGGGAIFQNLASNFKGGDGSPALIMVDEYGFFGLPTIPAGWVQRGALAGLTLSMGASSSTFTVSNGQCADSNAGDYITLASAMSKTQAAWAAGSGSGSLDTGTIATNTWYHVFAIKNPTTGAVDILISLSAGSPTLPSGYTLARRIGSLRVPNTLIWLQYVQLGDEFMWTTTVIDANNAAMTNANRTLYTLSVPSGIQVHAMFRGIIQGAAATTFAAFTSPDEADQIAGGSAAGIELANEATNGYAAGRFKVRTNASGQIGARANAAAGLWIGTFGWIDTRNRFA